MESVKHQPTPAERGKQEDIHPPTIGGGCDPFENRGSRGAIGRRTNGIPPREEQHTHPGGWQCQAFQASGGV